MKKAVVYGAGVSGLGAKKLLEKTGYQVLLVDDKKGIKKEEALTMLDGNELFIKSPGIGDDNELVQKALRMGIEVIDEIELAARNSNYKIIAVTGTNGKTTTTTKIKELLEYSGLKTEFAGNIGNTFAELVLEGREFDYVVLELSSYQLERVRDFKAHIAMSINHTPDHMTRYNTLEDYYDAKFNIFKNQTKSDYALLNMDDEYTAKVYKDRGINGQFLYLTQKGSYEKPDCYAKNGRIFYKNEEILEIDKMQLKGVHNIENALFIISTAKIVGVESEKIREFMYSTVGLEHRVEEFFKKGELLFINDSKGTNIDATIKALDSYNEKTILICGGKDKNLDLTSLVEKIVEKSKLLFLMGETADQLEELALGMGYSKENIFNLGTIERIIEKMKEILKEEQKNIVLFSPAASSFDQFKDYEERGKIFKELVIKNFK